MGKQIGSNRYYKLFRKFELMGDGYEFWSYFLSNFKNKLKDRRAKEQARYRFRTLYRKYGQLGYNDVMKINFKSTGRPKKNKDDNSDLDQLIPTLTREQLEEVARRYFEKERQKKVMNKQEEAGSFLTFSYSKICKLLKFCRTNKNYSRIGSKTKYEHLLPLVKEILVDSNHIYGSERICAVLKKVNKIDINPREMRRLMARFNLSCKIRIARKARESKDLTANHQDYVNGFDHKEDVVLHTDVSYIPANEHGNHVFLSAAISAKTGFVESVELSRTNSLDLVFRTLNKIKERPGMIVHSDRGFQYNNKLMIDLAKQKNYTISMGRKGKCLDNREIEYFFGNLKGEYLNMVDTKKMKFEEIKVLVEKYIEWYNFKRISGRLDWKTPAEASVYAGH